MAIDGAHEARAHTTGAETQDTAMDGAWEARVHVMGAETWGMATDGARDGAETWGTEGWCMGPCERCGCRRDMCNSNVHPEGPRLHVACAFRPWTMAAASGDRGGGAAGRQAKGGTVDKTDDMAGCCTMDRGSMGASGITWAVKGSSGWR